MNNNLMKIRYPDSYGEVSVYQHPDLECDLEELLEKSGYKSKFISQFRQRLKFLESKLEKCVEKSDWFESLKQNPGLYSMKLKGQLNIRIIFAIKMLESGKYAILLCGFHEKDTKDYIKAIEVAYARLNTINSFE